MKTKNFVIIGGGIGGVSCAETLCQLTAGSNMTVTLISASPLVKAAANVRQFGHTMESMDIKELESSQLTSAYPNLGVLHDSALKVSPSDKLVHLKSGKQIRYEKLCLTTGAEPKKNFISNSHVLSIRDTQSVQQFQSKLKGAERVVIVGNGGIATEMIYEIQDCEVIWAIKHDSVSATFFDSGAAQFFLPFIGKPHDGDSRVYKRWMYESESTDECLKQSKRGSALGPDWANHIKLQGASKKVCNASRVKVEYEVEVKEIYSPEELKHSGYNTQDCTGSPKEWPVYIKLSNGKLYGADMIINATGVTPCLNLDVSGEQPKYDDDGGVTVNGEMKTSLEDIYAAGDICSAHDWNYSPLWHQMRLWTQAKQMGCYAAKCMHDHMKSLTPTMDFCFELFTHVTEFFGFKVVLLGLFNAQGLKNDEYKMLIRYTRDVEYIKVVVKDNRVVGAVLIGETDLEETFENLILNQLDISRIRDHLLDPDIDIDDYFD